MARYESISEKLWRWFGNVCYWSVIMAIIALFSVCLSDLYTLSSRFWNWFGY